MKILKITALLILLMASTAFAQVNELISAVQLSVIKISAERIAQAQESDYEKFKESDSTTFLDKVSAF